MNQPTEQSFLRDVAKHEMTVIHDAGEIRHLRFGRPGDSNMHFNITTVPGYLMFTGDMGAWTFSRLPDACYGIAWAIRVYDSRGR